MKRKGASEAEPPVATEAPAPRARGAKAAPEEAAAAAPVGRQPDFFWAGQPAYRCRLCGDRYERLGDLQAVLEHEMTQHPTNLRATGVLGPDGRPVVVAE